MDSLMYMHMSMFCRWVRIPAGIHFHFHTQNVHCHDWLEIICKCLKGMHCIIIAVTHEEDIIELLIIPEARKIMTTTTLP